jgi:hypothetical protein
MENDMQIKVTATTAYINGKVMNLAQERKTLAAMMKNKLGMGKPA